jgi:V/A-type H+-transporting ATPase subunit K
MENLLTWPFILAMVGLAVMLTMTCIGSSIAVTNGGNALIGGLKKNPDIFGKGLILTALPSTQGLYGFAAFFLFLLKLTGMTSLTYMQGIMIFASGVALGLAGYCSAVWQAKMVSNGIVEMSNGQNVFGQTIILVVFPELYAILAFAAAFLVYVFCL